MRKGYKTQWVGQYAVACELTRNDYVVSMPLGNVPSLDLQCQRQDTGKLFEVQVKSLSSKGYFPLQNKFVDKRNLNRNLYFVFVYVPPDFTKQLEYFVLSHKQLLLKVWEEEKRDRRRRERIRKREGKKDWKLKWGDTEGIRYKFLNKSIYKNKWENLPH
jgi:hypothetical protein